jgi:ATP-dependent phosphoenolpyruvate carboxykinase
MPRKHIRAILATIHSDKLAKVENKTYAVFNPKVPKSYNSVPEQKLNPVTT